MNVIRRIVMTSALACMVTATIWPLVYGWNSPARNNAISWFWVAWALASLWWTIDSARHRRPIFFLAASLLLLGTDNVRSRLELIPSIIPPDRSGTTVWLFRIIVGWVMVIYIWHRARPEPV